MVAGVAGLPKQVELHFPQCAVDRTFRKLVPESYSAGAEFPVRENLNNDVTVIFTMALMRESRVKLSVPRMPKTDPNGSRNGWAQYRPEILREHMMPVQARALGLQPFTRSPKWWFNRSYLAKSVGRRWCAGDCKDEDVKKMLFVGQGLSLIHI